MTTLDAWTTNDSALAGLRAHDASAARVERIRVRCIRALAVQQQELKASSLGRGAWRRRLEPVVALGLAALYLAAAFVSSVALFR